MKNCVVEVEFKVGSKQFKIVRSIKPNKFEVWIDGNMANQNSHVNDYQAMLEKNIFKLNHKSFHQIVVLGLRVLYLLCSYPLNKEGGVIEDLLDINMFSIMNTLLKEKVSKLKDEINENSTDINTKNIQINKQKKYLRDISLINEQYRKEKEQSIKNTQEDIKSLNEKI